VDNAGGSGGADGVGGRPRVLVLRRRLREGDALDIATLATALDSLVGQVVYLGKVPRHLLLFLGHCFLINHVGEFGLESFDILLMVHILMSLFVDVSYKWPVEGGEGTDLPLDYPWR
jgi:hypothetical protein